MPSPRSLRSSTPLRKLSRRLQDLSPRTRASPKETPVSATSIDDTSIDDKYLGGKLPDDPFCREPVRSRYCQKTTRTIIPTQKLLPSVPVDSLLAHSKLPDTPDLDTDDSITSSPLSLPVEGVCSTAHSTYGSPASEASFHTCNGSEETHQLVVILENSTKTPNSEWQRPDMVVFPSRRSIEPLQRVATDEQYRVFENWTHCPDTPHPVSALDASNPSETHFTLKAAEQIFPLSIPAARVAFDRRTPFPVRRAVSSPGPPPHSRRDVSPRKPASYISPPTFSC